VAGFDTSEAVDALIVHLREIEAVHGRRRDMAGFRHALWISTSCSTTIW
jgi:hypothetical protein